MLISVIVPVYNVEKYLRECLDSLLRQTYKELEIVMVDDGSTDSSGLICDEYAEKYHNFFVIHKKNEGLGRARNTGLEHINGKYVTFLDSDDYISDTFVDCLYSNLRKNNVDLCKSGFQRVNDCKKVLLVRKYEDRTYKGKKARIELLPRLIGSRPDRKDSIEMCVCATLYAVSHIKQNNLRFPSERELISEDLVFNIDYMQYANGACTISDVGYYYRIGKSTLTTRYRKDRFSACCRFYLEMKKKCEALGYDYMTSLRLYRMFFVYVKMCISQENEKISLLSKQEHIYNIKTICQNKILLEVIHNYPKRYLGIKQKIFLMLIKLKFAKVLHFLVRLGML